MGLTHECAFHRQMYENAIFNLVPSLDVKQMWYKSDHASKVDVLIFLIDAQKSNFGVFCHVLPSRLLPPLSPLNYNTIWL